jgi:hypothetical protein
VTSGIFGHGHGPDERQSRGAQPADRDMTTPLYDECQLRSEFRRGFDLGAVCQNKPVDIAAAGESELLHLTAQRRELLRIVDCRR